MMKEIGLSNELMWQATINCDQRYNGIFYYGVITTKIFCVPSCKSKTPLRKNVLFFSSPEEAIKAGHRPCKRCRPDLKQFDPSADLANTIRFILETEYDKPITLENLSAQVGISISQLHLMFKNKYNTTPKEYLEQIRINKAIELLRKGRSNNTEICYATGFQSLSTFYRVFRKIAGYSPGQLRSMAKHQEL